VLRRGLAEALSSVVVKNSNVEGGRPLFDDTLNLHRNPDIVVEADNTSPVLSDVKYKDKSERTDLFDQWHGVLSPRGPALPNKPMLRATGIFIPTERYR